MADTSGNSSLSLSSNDASSQRIKRFRTAFILFSTIKHKEFRKKVAAEKERNGDQHPIKATEVAKLVSESWRTLPPNERAEWDKKAEQDRKRYQDEVNACGNPSVAISSKKDPHAPKRPMSAFLAYSNRKRAALKRESPNLRNGEMSKILSKAWKGEPEKERQRYICEARELRKQHKIAVKEWNKQVRKLDLEKLKKPPGRRKEEGEDKGKDKLKRDMNSGELHIHTNNKKGKNTDCISSEASKVTKVAKKSRKPKNKKPSAPKRPVSAFLAYSNGKKSALKRKKPDLSNTDLSRILSEQWKAEDPDIRQRFLDDAHDRRVKHKAELTAWHKSIEQRMRKDYQEHLESETSGNNGRGSVLSDTATGEDPESGTSLPEMDLAQVINGRIQQLQFADNGLSNPPFAALADQTELQPQMQGALLGLQIGNTNNLGTVPGNFDVLNNNPSSFTAHSDQQTVGIPDLLSVMSPGLSSTNITTAMPSGVNVSVLGQPMSVAGVIRHPAAPGLPFPNITSSSQGQLSTTTGNPSAGLRPLPLNTIQSLQQQSPQVPGLQHQPLQVQNLHQQTLQVQNWQQQTLQVQNWQQQALQMQTLQQQASQVQNLQQQASLIQNLQQLTPQIRNLQQQMQ